jgi:CHAT domain-containing protein/tetratricopeptide (TPR) repeat protein
MLPMRRVRNALAIWAILALANAMPARAEDANDAGALGALNQQVVQLGSAGKYKEATLLAQQTLALAERLLGADDVNTLDSINNLAFLYQAQERYGEAEPLEKRALEAAERKLGPDHPRTLISVNSLANLYYAEGRYAEAEPLYKRVLETSEHLKGIENPVLLFSLNSLAEQGRYNEAEPLFKRALEINERKLGQENPQTLASLNSLAILFWAEGRYAEAEPLYKRALGVRSRVLGKEHPDTLASTNNLANLYAAQGRYKEAEPLLQRALRASERVLGPDNPQTLTIVNGLAVVHKDEGSYAEAEPLLKRALTANERLLGSDNPETLRSMNNLAELYDSEGLYKQSEPLYARALAGMEHTLGPEHPETLIAVHNLAAHYNAQGRYKEAEPLFQRALRGSERVLGADNPQTLRSASGLAKLYMTEGKYAEAEALYKPTLEALERALGAEHPDTLVAVNALALIYQIQGRFEQAGILSKRALDADERTLGPDHPGTLTAVQNLALLYNAQGNNHKAVPLLKRVILASERELGPDDPITVNAANNLAMIYLAQSEWSRAAQLWRRSTAAITRRIRKDPEAIGEALTGKANVAIDRMIWQFYGLIKAVYRLAPKGRRPDAKASREMFETAQWALSSKAARSLAQMGTRGAAGNAQLAALVRERQDLVAEWRIRDRRRSAALGRPLKKRNSEDEAKNLARLSAIDKRVTEIDGILKKRFPHYAEFASPAPLSVAEVQAQLRPGEALVLFADTEDWKPIPEETFIWVVTKTDIRWVSTPLGAPSLTREVQALRCGLDADAWDLPHCTELLGQGYTVADRDEGKPLPFDHARAYRLYKALFGEAEDLIRGKNLLIVPSGALTQLPFHVLLTEDQQSKDGKSAAWLIRQHSLTVLPAVSSLKELREIAHASNARKPMIGFGDPLLEGPDSRYARLAQRARDRQACGAVAELQVAPAFRAAEGVAQLETRGGLADVSFLRKQVPLPETADELCAVARDLGADQGDILLGARATEREVKNLSETGKLAQYRIVHFATHGALAGQVTGSAEPGLLLTPPDIASEEDDGYLTASEIAALKLDADWVILSACNTAAGGAEGAEALSGLARAFFYAGARSLLVSHWAVNSDATVKLITSAMRQLAANASMSRAEAMRHSMLDLIDHSTPREAHPAYWAPFVVVGEGGAAR